VNLRFSSTCVVPRPLAPFSARSPAVLVRPATARPQLHVWGLRTLTARHYWSARATISFFFFFRTLTAACSRAHEIPATRPVTILRPS